MKTSARKLNLKSSTSSRTSQTSAKLTNHCRLVKSSLKSSLKYSMKHKRVQSIKPVSLFGFKYSIEGKSEAAPKIILPVHLQSHGKPQAFGKKLHPPPKLFHSTKMKPHAMPVVEPFLNRRLKQMLPKKPLTPKVRKKPIRIFKRSAAEFQGLIPITPSNEPQQGITERTLINNSLIASSTIINEQYLRRMPKRSSTAYHTHSNSIKDEEELNGSDAPKIHNAYFRNNFTIVSREVLQRGSSVLLSSLVGDAEQTPTSSKDQTGCNASTKCSTFRQTFFKSPSNAQEAVAESLTTEAKACKPASPQSILPSLEADGGVNNGRGGFERGYWRYRKLDSEVCLIKYLM